MRDRTEASDSSIETLLHGSRWSYIAQEFFTNSSHFPLANILLEILIEGPVKFLSEPDLYIIISASLIQAYFLGTWMHRQSPRPLTGNMIGPAIYTLMETAIEGPVYFFSFPSHMAYWIFSLLIGLLQESRLRLPRGYYNSIVLTESVIRTSILLVTYWMFEMISDPTYESVAGFLSDKSHIFVSLVIPLLGLMIGFANVSARSYLEGLRRTAAQLKVYSEWLLGHSLLSLAVTDPSALAIQRRKRTVLFMDIRSFTQWSESHQPEDVVSMLNAYFETAEKVCSTCRTIRTKFSGDEVMMVFPSEQEAVYAAGELCRNINMLLESHGLSAGIGVHSGPLVEGLIGSRDIKGYDVIGDTVNTARRICESAGGREILVSQSACSTIVNMPPVSETRLISVKGKKEAIAVSVLRA